MIEEALGKDRSVREASKTEDDDQGPPDADAKAGAEVQSDSEDDPLERFSDVLAALQLDLLPGFCVRVRQKLDKKFRTDLDDAPTAEVLKQPLFGSYNIVHVVRFQDGLKWVLKVPQNGHKSDFDDLDARDHRSEAVMMKLIRRQTSAPVPEVFAFDASLDNELGCPYILMEHVDGIPLVEMWFDKSLPKEEVYERRTRALRDIAAAMAQLECFSFDLGGRPTFDQDENFIGMQQERKRDRDEEVRRMFQEGKDDDEPIYFEAGPWSTPSSFYRVKLDRPGRVIAPANRGQAMLLDKFISWIPEPEDSRKPFVISHPDFDVQNFIVSADGELKAIIDWENISAVPRNIGYEELPGWLTRDWDPLMYGWSESMEKGVKPKGCWEDSPETLARHRADYANFMQSSLASVRKHRQPESTAHEFPSRTANSLYVSNLYIAATSHQCAFQIVFKFVNEIVDILHREPQPWPEWGYFDIDEMLVEDKWDDEQDAILKRGFLKLFESPPEKDTSQPAS